MDEGQAMIRAAEGAGAVAPPEPIRFRLAARVLRWMLRVVLRALFRFDIRGLEHLPRGRYIVAGNHPAWLETFMLFAFLPAERGLRVLASRDATTAVGWRRVFLDQADAVVPFDVDSGSEARTAIRRAVDLLERGSSIGIFPEDLSLPADAEGHVRPLRRGVAMLARVSQTAVVPLGVADTRLLWRGRTVRLRIGPPIDPPRDRREDAAFLARLAEQIEELRPKAEPLPARRPWPWLSKLF